MKTFHESLRYTDYVLPPGSIVWDVGVYEGRWSKAMADLHPGIKITGFEPIRKFYVQSRETCRHYPNIEILNVGLDSESGPKVLGVKGDSTGEYADGEPEACVMWSLKFAFGKLIAPYGLLACLKLNCEGAEYPILESMLESTIHRRVENIQVQNHNCVPDCEARWASIRERLLETHEITWEAPFCWTNFKLR